MNSSFVAFVGAGPGRPDLVTRRGLDLIARADHILVDDLVHPELYLRYAQPDAQIHYVGKRGGKKHTSQDAIESMLVNLGAGHFVVRLKGGDPMVFGRLQSELQAVRNAGIDYEIVPGVTAASGCAAYDELMITSRGVARSITMLTGYVADGEVDWNAAASLGTIVIYMGVLRLEQNVQALLQHLAPDIQVAVVERGTESRQRSLHSTLGQVVKDVKDANIRPPALVFVGRDLNVDQQHVQSWWARKPLASVSLVMARADDRGWQSADLLREFGADVWQFPLVRPRILMSPDQISRQIGKLGPSGILVVSSAIAARLLPDPATLEAAPAQVWAVGSRASEAAEDSGYKVVHCADHLSALCAMIEREMAADCDQVVHLCGTDHRPELAQWCADHHAEYRAVECYEMCEMPQAQQAMDRFIPGHSSLWWYLTSPRVWQRLRPSIRAQDKIIAIGATTANAIAADGNQVDIDLSDITAEQLAHYSEIAASQSGRTDFGPHDAKLLAGLTEFMAKRDTHD